MEVNVTALESTNISTLFFPKAKTDVSSIMDMIQVFFYSVVFLLGSIGNGVVIWITAPQISRTVNCIWFFHLALADFLFSVSRIVPLLKNAFYQGWPFGSFLCQANSFIKYLNMFCSVFILAAISLDRAASVAYPVWSKNHRGPWLAWLAAISSWVLAAATSLPFYLYREVKIEKENRTKCTVRLKNGDQIALYLLRLVCGFLVPFAIILICYGIITVILRRRRATFSSKKPFKVILVIVVTFFLCWAPYHLFLLCKLAGVKGQAISVGLPLASSLAYLNSCANPILYFFIGLDFRRKLSHFNLVAVFRKTLLEDSVYSFRKQSQQRRGTPSSINELERIS
ncbi:chemokine-like receptor 1 [Varanus komodoensis]|uniref:G-protein coupled receptors family 1 profile domain-containing protein n=1 Tax=Varanus komodoensis TaxID=61221 RepID=A0A8D2J904_VARKO|nr:chemokine-like receptor 1 [Varanus komodoensis]